MLGLPTTFRAIRAACLINALFLAILLSLMSYAHGNDQPWVVYEGGQGPGQGKHVVLLAGDEEYRSEEGLPMLAKVLGQKHGFKCTVLFPVDPATGEINPNVNQTLPGAEALDSADVILMSLRFRAWPDDVMRHFADVFLAGKPIIALRTSTHAFSLPDGSQYKSYNDFGKQVLGERWVSHWGRHKAEATRGIIEPSAQDDPLLRGVESIFGDSDVYEAYPPADAKILVRGQVLRGMSPEDQPADYRKGRSTDKVEQGINDPMMPIAWTRLHANEAGQTNKIFCTTMGAATDLQDEGLRRLVVNAVYWAVDLDVPERADVSYVGEFQPSMYGFNGYRKQVKPSDYAIREEEAGVEVEGNADATEQPSGQ